jgi:hypothetical protein
MEKDLASGINAKATTSPATTSVQSSCGKPSAVIIENLFPGGWADWPGQDR